MTCTHDLAEKETACADGMCPICQVAEIERLKTALQLEIARLGAAFKILRLEAEIERLCKSQKALKLSLAVQVEYTQKLEAALREIVVRATQRYGPQVSEDVLKIARAAPEGKP